MQRYFVPEEGAPLTLEDQKHIVKVMRMRSDERIIVCSKVCYEAVITVNGSEVSYQKTRELPAINKRHCVLIQGLPKHGKVETTIKYAAMIGVTEIILVPMKYSIAKQLPSHQKLTRYQMIAKEASELAHRDDIPAIKVIPKFEDIPITSQTYLLDEATNKQPLDDKMAPVTLIVGPEGGIHEQERAFLLEKGVKQFSLGPLILSSEIAGIVGLSKFMHFDI